MIHGWCFRRLRLAPTKKTFSTESQRIQIPCQKRIAWCDSTSCQRRAERNHERDVEFSATKIRVPQSPPSDVDVNAVLDEGWTSYFQNRSYRLADEMKDERREDQCRHSDHAMRSHLSEYLTHPMTLSREARRFGTFSDGLIVDIVGARAEAYAPAWVWWELAFFLCPQELHGTEKRRVTLRFVGPQLPLTMRDCEYALAGGQFLLRVEYFCDLYHSAETQNMLRSHDGASRSNRIVCLFNPGFAYRTEDAESSIRDSWRPTLESLFADRAEGSVDALVVTSYDAHDALEDMNAVKELARDMDLEWLTRSMKPQVNPFASMRWHRNPLLSNDRVSSYSRSNWSCLTI